MSTPDPERIDDDNPEWTEEDLQQARPAAELFPGFLDQKATDELLRPSTEQRKWNELYAYGEARFRARLQDAGLDPDRMNEDEKMDYVDRIIHEHRQEQREKQSSGQDSHPSTE